MSVFHKKDKVYILQKDLPDARKGDWFKIVDGAYYKFGQIEESYWSPEYVENNTNWFLPKEECTESEISLNDAKEILFENGYSLLKDGIIEMKFIPTETQTTLTH